MALMNREENIAQLEAHRENLANATNWEEYRSHHVAYIDALIVEQRALQEAENSAWAFVTKTITRTAHTEKPRAAASAQIRGESMSDIAKTTIPIASKAKNDDDHIRFAMHMMNQIKAGHYEVSNIHVAQTDGENGAVHHTASWTTTPTDPAAPAEEFDHG